MQTIRKSSSIENQLWKANIINSFNRLFNFIQKQIFLIPLAYLKKTINFLFILDELNNL